jgi:hypothetical protein
LVYRDFYATIAQVMPVLLLALIWDSGFLHRLNTQSRRPRRIDPSGVRWWTKPRVRVYALTVASVVIVATGVAVAVLAGLVPDGWFVRAALTAAAVLVLGTLLTRIGVDIIQATTPGEEAARTRDGSEPDHVV